MGASIKRPSSVCTRCQRPFVDPAVTHTLRPNSCTCTPQAASELSPLLELFVSGGGHTVLSFVPRLRLSFMFYFFLLLLFFSFFVVVFFFYSFMLPFCAACAVSLLLHGMLSRNNANQCAAATLAGPLSILYMLAEVHVSVIRAECLVLK